MANQPDVGDVHVDALLTNLSIAHMNKLTNFIADRVFPLVGVEKQSDVYAKYTRGDFFADPGHLMVRAPGTVASTTGYGVSKDNTFYCVNQAIGMDISDEIRANADAVFNMDRDAANLLTQIQMIRRERMFAADFMKTSVWTGGTGATDVDVTDANHGGAKWNDYGASDPIGDIEIERDTVELACGRQPNKLVLGPIGWRRLKHHPDFIDRIKYGAAASNPALISLQLLAQILELDEVLVSRAIYRSSDEGASLTLARVVDDDALLIYVPTAPSLLEPSAGYTFYWRPMTGGAVQFVRKGREERPKKDWIEAHSYIDHVATEPYAGAFFDDCVD